MTRWRLFVPLGVFVLMVVFLYAGFGLEDPHRLPSAMVGKAFPDFSLPALDDGKRVDQTVLAGRVTLVNVWATWCPTCKAEHAELMRIHEETQLPILGINYKDDPAAAREWLVRYGDPYLANVQDLDGRLGIDLGVYGAPESFLVDASGVIVYKRVGDVNRRIWEDEIAPRLAALGVAGATGGVAGATGGVAGATGGVAGATGGVAGATGGVAGATGGVAGATGGVAGGGS